MRPVAAVLLVLFILGGCNPFQRWSERPSIVFTLMVPETSPPHPKALVVIDDSVRGRWRDLSKTLSQTRLDPMDIDSLTVLNPGDAVHRFGQAAARGAVVIRARRQ